MTTRKLADVCQVGLRQTALLIIVGDSRSAKYVGIGPALAMNLAELMKADTKDALRSSSRRVFPLGRIGLAEEVASAALMLIGFAEWHSFNTHRAQKSLCGRFHYSR